MSDGRVLREFRVDVLQVVGVVSIPIVLVAIYRFGFPMFAALAIVVAEIAVSFVAMLLRFQRERRLIAEFARSVPPETVVVTSALQIPVLVHPYFFLQRRTDGLSLQRVGRPDVHVLLPWSGIRSISAPRAGNRGITITFHEGRSFRFQVAPAQRVTVADEAVVGWLQGGAEFPVALAAAHYLLPRTGSA